MRNLVAILLLPAGLCAQTAFEVASVKPNTTASGHSSTHSDESGLRMTNVSLKQCIEMAFDVKDYAFLGPDWLGSAKFDINAKLPQGASEKEIRPMMRTLLEERFKLAVHREPKVMAAYALTVAKGGAKLHEVEGGRGSSINSDSNGQKTQLTAKHTTMERLADYLARRLDRPVLDTTELKGAFDFTLEWAADDRVNGDAPAGPSIFSALQEQLGLRLQARKLPVETLVVDRVERTPTEN